LLLSGTVTSSGTATAGAIVALYRGLGDFVASVTCGESGTYHVPLPLAGAYVATAIDPHGYWAHSKKLVIGVQPTILDIEAPV
jgi:hypothetical protein